MEWPPLVPQGLHTECPEVSRVVREVFQEQLSHPLLPISETVETDRDIRRQTGRPSKNESLATKFIGSFKEDLVSDANAVEKDILDSDVDHFIKKSEIMKDFVLADSLKLKYCNVFRELEEQSYDKFSCLLRKRDVQPMKAELAVDFRYNTEHHSCKKPCPSVTSHHTPTNLCKPIKTISCKEDKSALVVSEAKKTTETILPVFTVKPKKLIFCNYELNKVYEKSFKLQNSTRNTHSFTTSYIPQNSPFTVTLVSETNRIAPGMHATFRVSFKPTYFMDIELRPTMVSDTGQKIEVLLKSCMNPPVLSIYSLRHDGLSLVRRNVDETIKTFDCRRASALNFTFDSGCCLLGDRVTMHLIVKNEGGAGEFFIMTEEDWYQSAVTRICKHTELCAGEFKVYPSYFAIGENDFVDLCLTFVPSYFGLHAERIYMLCNNNTYEELEVVGDGIVFDKDFVIIDVPIKATKLSFMDSIAEHYLYIGHCLSFSKNNTVITIKNSSSIFICYRWECRKSISFQQNTMLKQMETHWLSMKHNNKHGILPPDSSTDFQISIFANTMEKGLYSMVVSFYVESIPEASLLEKHNFCVVSSSKKTEDALLQPSYWDILIGEVEIACIISPPEIFIDPPQMILQITLKYREQIKKTIRLRNDHFKLNCKWKIYNKRNGQKCCVRIQPANFQLNPCDTLECQITICAHTYEDISEKIVLFANDGIYKKEYIVRGVVEKPKLQFSTNHMNFGFVPKGQKLEKTFTVESLCMEKINWQLIEFTYDFDKRALTEVNQSHVSINQGTLQENSQSVEITYKIDSQENQRWFSFLMLITSHPTKVASDALMLITYEVCQPKIRIHPPLSCEPILCPSELLYVGVSQYYVICIENDSNLCGYYIWGTPVGEHVRAAMVRVEPRAGIIMPGTMVEVVLELTAVQVGTFEHVYLPCFVGRAEEPVVLKIMFRVDTFRVNFLIPTESGHYAQVRWPSDGKIKDEDLDLDYNNYTYPESTENDATVVLENVSASTIDTRNEQLPSYILEDIEKFKSCGEGENESSKSDEIQDIYRRESDSAFDVASLKSLFDGDLTLFENVMEIYNVPLKTPVQRSFVIENLTPMSLYFNAEVTNFECAQVTMDLVENIMEKIDLKKSSKWDRLIMTGKGITVKIHPSNGNLEDYGTVQVDIWIYADTWGIYVEEIAVEINNSTPFCFNLLIQVTGTPIEFPMNNHLQEEVSLRFRPACFHSEDQTRNVRIANISSVPVMISWHAFVKDEENLESPFNLICEIPGNETDDNGFVIKDQMFMSERYYGREIGNKLIELKPTRLIIEAHSTNNVLITFKPRFFDSDVLRKTISSVLVGYIYLTEEERYQSNLHSRPVGVKMQCVILNVTSSVEMPLFKLHSYFDHEDLTAFATDIILYNKTFQLKAVFTKESEAQTTLNCFADAPLMVTKIQCNDAVYCPSDTLRVSTDECVEVDITCNLTGKYILALANMIYGKDEETEIIDRKHKSITLKRFIHLQQTGVVRQSFPMSITLYFPQIDVSDEVVHFDVVHIGQSKKHVLTIFNLTGCPVNFCTKQEHELSNFIVKPKKGLIPKASGTSRSSTLITIYFAPTQVGKYQATLTILTDIPVYEKTITLIGNGSHNERYMRDIV